jgi:hypothetical protein
MNGKVAGNLAKYNGKRWEGVFPGAEGLNCPGSGAYITRMQEYNNSLYVIGMFTKIGGTDANKIARYTGEAWCPVEYGTDLRPKNLTVYNNDLIINGDFYSIAGKDFGNIAGYNPVSSATKSAGRNKPITEMFSLKQNYPNPFNPTTEIKFSLSHPSEVGAQHVKIVVYNSVGEQIAELINGYMESGTHSITFNGSNLASGIYFYRLVIQSDRLTSGSFTDVKKMVLIK